ncbi:MAG: PAS domain S-box protein [Bacteroidales bacterium]
MASKVALLFTNEILPVSVFCKELEEIGYSCIIIENLTGDIELPSFNVAIVGIGDIKQKDLVIALSQNFLDKPFLFYSGGEYSNDLDIYEVVSESNFVSSSFTPKELKLAIELTNLKRKQNFASIFSDNNPNSNHVRLKKILSEEQAWRVLFEQSPNGVLLGDNHGNIVYTNRAAGEILGYTPQELLKMRFHDLASQDEAVQVDINIRRILEGETLLTEVCNFKKDGSKQYVQLHETRVIFPDGNFGIMVVSTDISRAKQAEEALVESMEKYQILVERSNDGIMYIKNGVIIYGNPRVLEMIAVSCEEFIGKLFSTFIHSSDREHILERYNRRSKGFSEPSIYETLLISPTKGLIYVEFNVNQAHLHEDIITIVFIRDISKRKEIEKAIRESEESYRGLFDNSSEAICILDSSGVFLDVNRSGQKMFGYTKDEIVGMTTDEIAVKDLNDISLIRRKIKQAYQGHNQILEFWGTKKNGQVIPNEIFLSKGNYFGLQVVTAMARDISERKNAEAILKESEEKFRAMIMAIPDQLFRITREGRLLDFAPSEQVFYPELSVDKIGNFLGDYLPKEAFTKFTAAIELCRELNSLQTFEHKIEVDGKTYFYESRIISVGNESYLVLQRDVTQQKKIEEDVRMLAQAIMNANDSISITDLDNNIIFVNPAFTQIYGYSQSEIIGKNTTILKPLDSDRALDYQIMIETMQSGWKGELINVKKDGSVFPIGLSTSSVFDEFGCPIAMVGIANDITERKKTEQELIRAKEKAEESDKLKTAFLSNMSHEIRSPMNAVLGFIQLLKEEEHLTETGKQYIDLIQNSGNQLLSLIEDIIDISKIQSNQLRISKSPFDLNQCMEELFTIFSSQLKFKSEVKAMLFPPELANTSPFIIYSDPLRIKQIVTNLLSNAIKFTPSGSIKFGYTLIIDDDSSLIKFFVKDTGIGISSEKLNLIFERFRQADDSYSRVYGGSGLGLAISKGLVELLGGHIWADSQINEGAEFYFTIPYVVDEFNDEDKQMFSTSVQINGELLLTGKTILIVEDTKDIRLYFERILERTGAKLIFATSAKEARKLFKQEKSIDLVLLDIRLPDSDGYNLALEFKRVKPNMPIIAQTAYALQSELNKSIASGCDDYITKPLDSEALYGKIHRLLNNNPSSIISGS